LSPEDNDAPEVGCLATSPHPRSPGYLFITNKAQRSWTTGRSRISKSHNTSKSRNQGETIMLPFIIFLMILTPVLIPAAVTAADAMKRFARQGYAAGYPRTSARLAAAAA
jgi:hypothetical protein